MINIRAYGEADAESVGRLITDTYGEYNLGFASPEEQQELLAPLQFARSTDEVQRTTGIRNGWSFEDAGLRYQPMKKTVA